MSDERLNANLTICQALQAFVDRYDRAQPADPHEIGLLHRHFAEARAALAVPSAAQGSVEPVAYGVKVAHVGDDGIVTLFLVKKFGGKREGALEISEQFNASEGDLVMHAYITPSTAPPAALDVETKMFLIDDLVPQRVIVEVWHNNEIIAGDSLELPAAQPSNALYDPSLTIRFAVEMLDQVKRDDWKECWSDHDEKVRSGLVALLATHPTTPFMTPLCDACGNEIHEGWCGICPKPNNAAQPSNALSGKVTDAMVEHVGKGLYIYWDDVNAKCRQTYAAKVRKVLETMPDALEAMKP